MMADIDQCLDDGQVLAAHAPTGVGKTAASLTPLLEDATSNDGTVFFVTPRHSQHEIALETIREMNDNTGSSLNAVDLLGKTHMCDAPSGGECPRKEATVGDNGPTPRARKKLAQLIGQNLSAEELVEECSRVCPYTLTLYMLDSADLVVADYFHVFSSGIREQILSRSGDKLNDISIVVDEAHNLPSRSRDLLSSTISDRNLQRAIDEADRHAMLSQKQLLEKLQRTMSELVPGPGQNEIPEQKLLNQLRQVEDIDRLLEKLNDLVQEVESEDEEESETESVVEFIEAWRQDNPAARYAEADETSWKIRASCLTPQPVTQRPLNRCRTAVLMSGTLKPQSMYKDLLGIEDMEAAEYESTFPEENELNLAVSTVSSRYDDRDDSTYDKFAWYIQRTAEEVDGNCAAFFPSYGFAERVENRIQHDKTYIEQPGMSKQRKQEIVDEFSSQDNALLVAPASGSLGEGVDYPGDALRGVFIAGLPLRPPTFEAQQLVDFLDDRYGEGWNYGYTYPAINSALQAAGRCIRSSEDEGTVVYIDERYTWSQYRKLLPKLKETRSPWTEVEEFFS